MDSDEFRQVQQEIYALHKKLEEVSLCNDLLESKLSRSETTIAMLKHEKKEWCKYGEARRPAQANVSTQTEDEHNQYDEMERVPIFMRAECDGKPCYVQVDENMDPCTMSSLIDEQIPMASYIENDPQQLQYQYEMEDSFIVKQEAVDNPVPTDVAMNVVVANKPLAIQENAVDETFVDGHETIVRNRSRTTRRNTAIAEMSDQQQNKENGNQFYCFFEGCAKGYSSHSNMLRHAKVHQAMPFGSSMAVSSKPSNNGRAQLKTKRRVTFSAVETMRRFCRGCNKPFDTYRDYDLHMEEQQIGQPFRCDQLNCSKEFALDCELQIHKLKHIVVLSSMQIKPPQRIKQDVPSVMDERGKQQFVCELDDCNKRYASKSAMRAHQRIRHQLCTFVCNVPHCYEAFIDVRTFEEHKLAHAIK